jgi:hypothetical protein
MICQSKNFHLLWANSISIKNNEPSPKPINKINPM